jgi:hypothetical protein
MAETRKAGSLIELTYQATKATTGLTDVTMEIYDETRAKDGVNFPDVTMTEIGSTGRYYGSFSPDAEGDWRVMIDSASKSGKVVRDFKIVGHDIDSVGDAVGALNDVSTAEVNTEVDTALADYGAPTKAELDSAELAIRGADSDTLETLSDQLDNVEGPPMLG